MWTESFAGTYVLAIPHKTGTDLGPFLGILLEHVRDEGKKHRQCQVRSQPDAQKDRLQKPDSKLDPCHNVYIHTCDHLAGVVYHALVVLIFTMRKVHAH
jgi:hypothetical protein